MADLFKEKAEDFDTNDVPRQLSAGIGACILDNVELNDGMQVMDFGAGTGLITAQVAGRVNKVTCVDVSEAMLEKLAAKQELQGKVDIVCAMAMHHVEDTDKLVQRFAEHLKPGGQVALADLDEEDGTFHPEDTEGVYHSGFNRDAFSAILKSHGFKDIHIFDATSVQREQGRYPVFLAVATKGE
jgi:2-polyprenyl-3-methyl-5-hydroxy-6-metoxy-1,4-benzoquinol methylase